MTKKITRREFFRAACFTSAAVVLTACSKDIVITPLISGGNLDGNATSTPAPTSSGPVAAVPPPADSDKLGIQLVARGGRGIINQSVVDAWNANSKAQLSLVGGNWGFGSSTDIASMLQTNIASGNQPWDGYTTITSPYDLTDFVKKEVIVPLDDLLKLSSVPGGGLVLSSILPSIQQAIRYEGKVYGLPANVNSTAFVYYPQTLKDAGFDGIPQTYDDVHSAALLVKKKFPDLTPFFSTSSPLTDLWAWMWGASQRPIDSDGLIDIRSPEAIDALTWLRRMQDDGLTINPQSGGGGGGDGGGFFRHGAAMMASQDSFGFSNQAADPTDATQPQGKPAVLYSLAPKTGVPNAGVPLWVNLCTVLNKGKNPQGMVNFYMWLFGPNNKDIGKQIAQNAPKPCYTYIYTSFVQTNPDLAWEQQGVDLIAKSTWFPLNTSHTIEQNTTRTHIQNVLDAKKAFSAEFARSEMQAAYDEIQTALGKG